MAKEKKRKSGMARLFELASAHKGLLTVSGIFAVLASVASFVPYIAVYLVVKETVSVYPDFAGLDVSRVTGYGLLAVAGIAADVVCFLLSSICAHLAAFATQYELKSLYARHLAKVPLGFHLTIGTGRLRKVINQDIEKMEQFLAHTYPDMVASFTAPIVLLVLLFVFDWRFGLATFIAVILAFAIQMMTIGAAGPEVIEQMQKREADMSEASVEYVRGMPVLKAFGQTALSFRQLCDAIRSYAKITLTYTLKWENYLSAFTAIINNIYLFILPVGILIGSRTADYPGFVMSFLFYLLFVPAIASVLHKFMYVSSSSMRIAGGVANFDSMMALPELTEAVHSGTPADSAVSFRNVSFSYEGAEAMALSDVSFTAQEGKVTAIVGSSGGGKSTIAHLIPRFWDVSQGSISIGGVDIREMTEAELMSQVSFVFQDVYLFHQSIKENIRMGRPDASDEEIRQAASAAMCDEFVLRLPNGYDTVLGEEGVHLSGGESQRISVARAIIKNAPVLVLDEATAFADPENEQMIQAALARLMKGKTVIMIAHRLGTVKDADMILVMESGKIAETGTHQSLIEENGLYTQMWKRYTQTLSWGVGRKEVMA
ncbi:ABC transporter ATP-binding protein [Lachnoclostridium sp. Marseille-P6806]|uniref:ABC transporter ATP-binding protein n=1 Tax=Lachnoclostridium sp. Marseille-P6806 TaxID=2364793 RepID=UPI001031ABDD|nr:ABC transporter ATP-binding protein [Lachnoclostridium sp. Marseille-P6806]